MIRRDNAYWQRLRKDRRSNAAAILAAIAVVAGTTSVLAVTVPGTQYQARANPLYWALMLPGAWWVIGLTEFGPKYVRLWKPVLGIACVAAGASLVVEASRYDDWGVSAVTFATTIAAAAASLALYRGSLVAREGPAR